MNIDEMRIQVIADFAPKWELNDEAHRLHHFAEVESCGHHINQYLDLRVKPELIMLGAFFHDLFAWSRFNHHELSHLFVKTCDYPIITALSESDRNILAMACLHHRASFKGEFIYTLDELINSADRMMPEDTIDGIVTRSLLYSLNKCNNEEEAIVFTHRHVREKFGTNGYARYPRFYLHTFEGALDNQHKQIDALTLEATEAIYEKAFHKNSVQENK